MTRLRWSQREEQRHGRPGEADPEKVFHFLLSLSVWYCTYF